MASEDARVEREHPRKRLPFGADIWTSGPEPKERPHVHVDIYGPKHGRLYAGDTDVDWLWLQVGDHVRLAGTSALWEEFAELLNEALRQRRLYREAVERPESESQPEAER